MNEVILKAENVFYSYDDGKTHSLNGLSLEIRRGKKIAVMGANGSGKSTFFLCCNGVYRPSEGTIYFHGKPVDYSRKGLLQLRQKVGIVFQDPDNQLFSASVFQEISFGILNLGVPEEEARKEVERIMDEMEITPYRDRLDEPAAGLDAKHTVLVNQAVDRMTGEGITVMMATHDVNYAMEWADEVMIFRDGTVAAHGVPEQVFEDKQLLRETNLEQPAVLQLFDSLKKKGILKEELPLPRSLGALLQEIERLPSR